MALCLATKWRVAAVGASFVFGNLPRGMNPLFMLSRSLPSVVGGSPAMAMYLDDTALSLPTALESGVVDAIGNSIGEAKMLAGNKT